MATGKPGETAPQWFADPLSGADINAAMSPYIGTVVSGVRDEFGRLRDEATVGANQEATMAGAFGGSRHGVMEGTRLGELDRAQASTIGGLLNNGYSQAVNLAEIQRQQRQQQLQNPLFAQQQGLNLMNLGMGPVGASSTTNEKGSADPWGQIAGSAITAYGIYKGAQQGGNPGGGNIAMGGPPPGAGGYGPVGRSGFQPWGGNLYPQKRGLFG